MSLNPYANQLETQVLSASPLELVQLVYREAIEALRAARRHLAAGDIAARSAAAARAMNLVGELAQSLDRERGGAIAADLAELYGYLLRRIQEGNFQQQDAPFEEALRLLTTLLEAWQSIGVPAAGYSVDEAGMEMAAFEPLSLTA